MQVNLNTPPIIEGPLSAEQLDRKVNPGTIYRLHGEDGQVGCSFLMPAEAATEVGHTEPSKKSAPFATVLWLFIAVPIAMALDALKRH